MNDIIDFFRSLRNGGYQNDNFNRFLKHVKFKYNIPSIHIAGSNGKGSTANYLASIYKAFGLKVGLFTSPFLFKYNEMIKINGKEISEENFCHYIKKYEKLIKKFDLSLFEVQTFVALSYFNDSSLDLAIIECGMGGEIDATNCFTPIVSVITSVSLEHTSFLGRSISEIAYHKAGIIKPHIPVVIGKLPEEAKKTIYSVSNDSLSKVYEVVDPSIIDIKLDTTTFSYLTYKNIKIYSQALYSVTDACIALEVINVLKEQYNIDNETILEGFDNVHMDCRMDFIAQKPCILIDGAHNVEGMKELKKSLNAMSFNKPIRTIFACFLDKNLQGMLNEIGEISTSLILTTFEHPRARKLEDYFLFQDDYKCIENPIEAIKELSKLYPEDLILITGSLAFASYIKKAFKNGELDEII